MINLNQLIRYLSAPDFRSLILKVIITVVVFFASPLVHAQIYETSSGLVEFDSFVPLHTFTGTSEKLIGQINLKDGIVDFYLDLSTLKTGIDKRDRDMRETLETKEYPFAEFYGTLENISDSGMVGPQSVVVNGEFKIHGVTKIIRVEGTIDQTPEGLNVNASWDLNIKDYDIEPPGILFYKVSEVQKIRMNVLLKSKMSMQK